jgi:hypothetical protein
MQEEQYQPREYSCMEFSEDGKSLPKVLFKAA